MIVHPVKNYVLLRLAKEEAKFGSLYKPVQHLKPIPEGEVKALGPDCKHLELGQRVVAEKLEEMGIEVNVDGKEHLLIKEDSIMAVME